MTNRLLKLSKYLVPIQKWLPCLDYKTFQYFSGNLYMLLCYYRIILWFSESVEEFLCLSVKEFLLFIVWITRIIFAQYFWQLIFFLFFSLRSTSTKTTPRTYNIHSGTTWLIRIVIQQNTLSGYFYARGSCIEN